MIAVLKGAFKEFNIGIIEYSNFESRQFLSISTKFSDWRCACCSLRPVNKHSPDNIA